MREQKETLIVQKSKPGPAADFLVGNDTSDQTSSYSSATFANVEALTGFGSNRTMSFENHFYIVTGHDHPRLVGAWESEIGSFVWKAVSY